MPQTLRIKRVSGARDLGAVALVIWWMTASSFGQTPLVSEDLEVTSSVPLVGHSFGRSVALHDDAVIVGAIGDQAQGVNAGAAFVFRVHGQTLVQEQKLLASDGAPFDNFGLSVDIDRDVAIVGATGDDDAGPFSGAAYVFRFLDGQWIEEQKLVAEGAQTNDGFGQAVAISGNIAVVSADLAQSRGAVYVFRRTDGVWTQVQVLSEGSVTATFGYRLSLTADHLVVSAPLDSSCPGITCGTIYVFRRDEDPWTLEQALQPDTSASNQLFGISMDAHDGVIVGGVPNEATNQGAAYVFRFDGESWVQEQKLLAGDGIEFDRFAEEVAVFGDRLLAAAPHHDAGADDSGAAYEFRFDGTEWSESRKLVRSDPVAGDQLGSSIAAQAGTVIVGAIDADGVLIDSGVVDVFVANEFLRGDCNADGDVQLSDGVRLLMTLFQFAPLPLCGAACDANDDGNIDLGDAIAILNHVFMGGAIPEPFDTCGEDPSEDSLFCWRYESCP